MLKPNKPKDTPFLQQYSTTYFSDLSVYQVSVLLLCIGLIFTPMGAVFKSDQNSVYEQTITYDGTSSSSCHISSRNQGRQCSLSFTLSEDVDGDLFVYYKLSNFYQNHRRYIGSLSLTQLQGENLKESAVSLDCNPLLKNGSLLLNPCGLIANSFFNDQISVDTVLSSLPFVMDESDISLQSDRDEMFKQVTGFKYKQLISPNVTCLESGLPFQCKQYTDSDGVYYNYYYPDDSTVQYLYESYPGIISPLDGVTNEHFIVWMRTASLPTFRKLYGKIDGPFTAGQTIVFDVTANYEVASFGGTKALLISSIGSFGGKNRYIGELFLSSGIIFLLFGSFLAMWETYTIWKIKKMG